MTSADTSGALRGVTVLELADSLAGAYAGRLLRDAGATVLRPTDLAVHFDDGGTGPDPRAITALIDSVTGGREPITADEVEHHLEHCQIVLCDNKWPGFDAREAWQRRPTLSVVAITEYGLDGPSVGHPTSSAVRQAASGSTYWRGLPGEEPLMVGGDVEQYLAGSYAASAAMTGLRAARTRGRGELFDLSLFEVGHLGFTTFGTTRASLWDRLGEDYPPRSIQTPAIERTSDGWVGLCTISARQRQDLMLIVGRPDLAEDEAIAYAGTDNADTEEIRAAIGAWTATQTTDEIIDLVSAFRIPVAPIGCGANLIENEQLRSRDFFECSESGTVRPGPAFRLGAERTVELPASRAGSRAEAADLPLAGVRVLDLTAWWAGPAATHLLAALGADVVKVESATRPDGMRYSFVPDPGADAWWEFGPVYYALNTNKRGVTVDFTTTRGLEVLSDLAVQADILIENFTPRVLDSLDLDWDLIHKRNPGLLTVRMPAFGLEGPWRDRTGFAQTIEQSSGLAWTTGHPDGPPVVPRGVCDPLAGIHAAFATLVALENRDRHGTAGQVEVSMLEVAVTAALGQALAWRTTGTHLGRLGNRNHTMVPQGVYACSGTDDWLALTVRDTDDWQQLVRLLRVPGWDTGVWLDAEYRREHADRIDAEIRAWTGTRAAVDAAAALGRAGVPAARVDGSGRLLDHPQLIHRSFFEQIDHPVAGAHPVPGLPFRISDPSVRWNRTPAPLLGQHTDVALADWLGYDPSTLAELEALGVTGTTPRTTSSTGAS